MHRRDSAARLSEYVADTLDRFEYDLIFADKDGDRFAIKLEEHLALGAITAEGSVKHELLATTSFATSSVCSCLLTSPVQRHVHSFGNPNSRERERERDAS